jgi:hypothetical protein
MQNRDEYKDPIIERIKAVLEADGPERLRGKYYHGDTMLVPKEELPIATISIDEEHLYAASTQEDEHYVPVVINVIYDYTRDLNQSYDLAVGATGLYDMIAGRGADYLYKEKSMMRALWKNQQLAPKFWIAVGQNERIITKFGMGIERRGKGIYSTEAVVRFSVKLHLPQIA